MYGILREKKGNKLRLLV